MRAAPRSSRAKCYEQLPVLGATGTGEDRPAVRAS
jgi:hypothetical protein